MTSLSDANSGFRTVSNSAGTFSNISVSNIRMNEVSANTNPPPDMFNIETLPAGPLTATIPLGQKDLYIIGINGAAQTIQLHIDLNATRPDSGRRVTIYNDSNAQVSLVHEPPVTLTANTGLVPSGITPIFDSAPPLPVQFAFLYANGNEIRLTGISI